MAAKSRGGKRSGNQRGGNPRGAGRNGKQPARQASESADDLIKTAQRLDAVELEQLDGAEPPDAEVTGEIDLGRLREAIGQTERAQDLARRRKRAYEEGVADLEKKQQAQEQKVRAKEQEIAKREEDLEANWEKLDDATTELERRQAEVAEADKSVADRKAELLALEQEAKSSFAGYRQEQMQLLRADLDERRRKFDEYLQKRETDLNERRAKQEEELASRAAKLQERLDEFAGRESELKREQRRIKAREEFLEQEIADRVKDRESQLTIRLDLAQQDAHAWQQRHAAIQELAEKRAGELAEREAAEAVFAGMSTPEAAEELKRLRMQNAGLRREAAAHPVADKERIAELESRYHDLVVEREELIRDNAELRRHIAASKISAVERENARMVTKALQAQNTTLATEIRQQTEKWAELQAVSKQSSPFPACFAMDDREEYKVVPELEPTLPELLALVQRIRKNMAARLGLFYAEGDMRCFLAGVAASRLHLLEGISGIGKTRLPEAFARVIGATCETIAVAAEWRSPQDLTGYYNAFERKFYETDFTQALYKAQLPLFRHKPFFVVLDEMNLSHPEQYFSDWLSAIERKENNPGEQQWVRLMTSRVDPAPRLLRDGRDLQVPDNVWFVGTANHDETTVRFADKTYDRAHVLELPAKPRSFDGGNPQPLTPISLSALQTAFDTAEQKHQPETRKVLDYFESQLGDRLRDGFGVSWGPRLERQAKRFVPVVIAAGGKVGEAADHLLATKILRKLEGRVEVPATELKALGELVKSRWADLCPGSQPVKSLRVLQLEARSRGTR